LVYNYFILGLENHPNLLNKFFIGVLLNKSAVINNGVRPEYVVLFSFEAGFSRESLVGFCLQYQSRQVPSSKIKSLQYDIINYTNEKVDFYFTQPIIVSLKGSSYEFVRSVNSYILRHPRLIKDRTIELDIADSISFEELQVSVI
jgi:hypothetical protein